MASKEKARARQARYQRTDKGQAASKRKCKAYRDRMRAENPDEWYRRMKAQRVRTNYGLSVDEYEAIIAKGCAICGAREGSGKLTKLHLDHDHATGQVRDALCPNCNHGLGHFKDDPARLEQAAEYLRAHGR